MRNLIVLILACCSIHISSHAQQKEEKSEKPVELRWTGFVMNNFFYDSRRMNSALDGLVTIFPLNEELDINGKDINASPEAGFLSLASRLRANISGPDALGAVTSAAIELDFTGRANTATVRFRQAWVNFNWGNTSLLVGRNWNQFVSIEVIPQVISLNIGIPFQPFNRSDQITLTQKAGNFSFIASASYQNDFVNVGPLGRSAIYQNKSVIPNLHGQMKYKSENTILGIGLDYKRLKPKEFTISPENGGKYKAANSLGLPAILGYAQIKSNKLTLAAKSILAANANENIMVGAFGIKSVNQQTGAEEYTPYKHWFLWTDIRYGNKVKTGVLFGYLKNLGAVENLVPTTTVYGLGENIAQMYKVSPSITYSTGKVMMGFEIEHFIVDYGSINHLDKGKIINTNTINSTRVLSVLYYNF
jgi:hypothetical protein